VGEIHSRQGKVNMYIVSQLIGGVLNPLLHENLFLPMAANPWFADRHRFVGVRQS
jgi:hypothetical protein